MILFPQFPVPFLCRGTLLTASHFQLNAPWAKAACFLHSPKTYPSTFFFPLGSINLPSLFLFLHTPFYRLQTPLCLSFFFLSFFSFPFPFVRFSGFQQLGCTSFPHYPSACACSTIELVVSAVDNRAQKKSVALCALTHISSARAPRSTDAEPLLPVCVCVCSDIRSQLPHVRVLPTHDLDFILCNVCIPYKPLPAASSSVVSTMSLLDQHQWLLRAFVPASDRPLLSSLLAHMLL